jgi:hypothetical protein
MLEMQIVPLYGALSAEVDTQPLLTAIQPFEMSAATSFYDFCVVQLCYTVLQCFLSLMLHTNTAMCVTVS